MFRKTILAASLGALMVSAHAADGISVSADVQARVGVLSRSGVTAPDFDNSTTSIDGNYGVFITGNKDLKRGYTAGFYCHTVATTSPGASAGFRPEAMPVKNGWAGVFAGQENFPQNSHGGGFASYGESNGDNLGPFCNDEVYGSLATPFGTIKVGNMMNPMRLLYDMATVDPQWGNQYGYYHTSDIRGNAVGYSNSFGPVRLDLGWNTATSASTPSSVSSKGQALTAIVSYEFDTSMIGAGFMTANGKLDAKTVQPAAGGAHNKSFGVMAKTLVGKVNLGYTFLQGIEHPDDFPISGHFRKLTDNVFRATYDVGSWSLQGFLSAGKERVNGVGAWGGGFTVQDGSAANNGKTFNVLNMNRTSVDLWALYNLGNGTQPYLRFNTIQKKYSAEDINYSATMRSNKIEVGWMIHI